MSVPTPGVLTLCASIKLCSAFISSSCLDCPVVSIVVVTFGTRGSCDGHWNRIIIYNDYFVARCFLEFLRNS